MFRQFTDHHLAIGSYASDWDSMGRRFVLKRIEIDYAEDSGARARA
jgi:hypothetical protein